MGQLASFLLADSFPDSFTVCPWLRLVYAAVW